MKASELKSLTVQWLSEKYKKATIVEEMSIADWGGALVDVAAITDKEIIGVEINGEGDSPTRLDLQGYRYGQVANKMWLLVTPEGTLAERCYKKQPQGWGLLEVYDGKVRPYNRFKVPSGEYEKTKWGRRMIYERSETGYKPDAPKKSENLNPWAMCGTLWRDELYEISCDLEMDLPKRARVKDITNCLISKVPVPVLHDEMVKQLRKRKWRKKVIDLRIKGE